MTNPLKISHGWTTAGDEARSDLGPRVVRRVVGVERQSVGIDVGDYDGTSRKQVMAEPASDALWCAAIDDAIWPTQ